MGRKPGAKSNTSKPRGKRYQTPSPQGSKAKTADEKARKEEKFGKFKQKVKAKVIVLKPFEEKYQARIVEIDKQVEEKPGWTRRD